MSVLQNHKIHTVSIQVEFEGMEEGLGVQDSLGLYFYEKIKPALEKTFDQYSDPKKTLVIDRLELDCGIISYENWEAVFVQRVIKQLGEELNSPEKSNTTSISIENKASEVFFFFLQKGYFPWNSPFSTPKDLEKAIVFDTAFLNDLENKSQWSSAFTERLFKSFGKDFISKIFKSLSQKLHPQIITLVKNLQASAKPIVQKELMQVLLFFLKNRSSTSMASFLKILISNFSKESLPDLAEYLSRKMVREKKIRVGLRSLLSETTPPDFRRKFLFVMEIINKKDPEILEKMGISVKKIDLGKTGSNQNNNLEKSNFSDNSFENYEAQEKPNTPADKWDRKEQVDLEPDEEIFIENAGLVLLHPFLPGLFSNLQLTKNREFAAIHEQFVASKILQFLAFGENGHTENLFSLNKILCGIGLIQALDLELALSHESKAECEELLKEVIRHWSVLKNTSIAGLRETFLQRNGKISRVEKGWKLQVERKTVDVLLAKLPWGLGIIKLPWMNEMIFVEWE